MAYEGAAEPADSAHVLWYKIARDGYAGFGEAPEPDDVKIVLLYKIARNLAGV